MTFASMFYKKTFTDVVVDLLVFLGTRGTQARPVKKVNVRANILSKQSLLLEYVERKASSTRKVSLHV